MVKHMKEHLIGKSVSDVEHINSDSIHGECQTGMKISFSDGTTILITIEKDEDNYDHPNLDWHIKHKED